MVIINGSLLPVPNFSADHAWNSPSMWQKSSKAVENQTKKLIVTKKPLFKLRLQPFLPAVHQDGPLGLHLNEWAEPATGLPPHAVPNPSCAAPV